MKSITLVELYFVRTEWKGKLDEFYTFDLMEIRGKKILSQN